MKNISEYLIEHQTKQINEFVGMLIAGAFLSAAIFGNVLGIGGDGNSKGGKDKDDKSSGGGFWSNLGSGLGMGFAGLGAGFGALISNMIGGTKDPIEKEQQKSILDIFRSANQAAQKDVDSDDKDATDQLAKKQDEWMKKNLSPDDYKAMQDYCTKQSEDVDPGDLSNQLQEKLKGLSQEDIDKENEEAKKVYADKGQQIEQDAEARREMIEKQEKLEKEKAEKQIQLDAIIAKAVEDGDKDAEKKARLDKINFNKDIDSQIFAVRKQVTDHDINCASASILNAANPAREERVKKADIDVKEAEKKLMSAYDSSIKDINDGGTGENQESKTEPKEASTPAEKSAQDLQKAIEDAEKEKKDADDKKAEADKAVEDAEKALNDNKDDVKKDELQKAVDDAKKKQEDAQKAVDDAQKKLDDATKAKNNASDSKGEKEPEKTDDSKGEKKNPWVTNWKSVPSKIKGNPPHWINKKNPKETMSNKEWHKKKAAWEKNNKQKNESYTDFKQFLSIISETAVNTYTSLSQQIYKHMEY